MTWEETIEYIRKNPEYDGLVKSAYFSADLPANVELFKNSEEYVETIKLIRSLRPDSRTILDIGCGNGISSVAFALDGFEVTAVEPDPSDTVGAGAVRSLKNTYSLKKLDVQQDFAENLGLPSDHYDIVYFRQAMHHAYDLPKFIAQAARVLRPGGLLLAIRDHVIFDEKDKEFFLQSHPLQKFYGGENAFSPKEYRSAMTQAGLTVSRELRSFDTPINYFPMREAEIARFYRSLVLGPRFGFLWRLGGLVDLYVKLTSGQNIIDAAERKIAGRMYSYICTK